MALHNDKWVAQLNRANICMTLSVEGGFRLVDDLCVCVLVSGS